MSEIANMMTCRELVELVTAYIEGRLEPGEHSRFEGHLRECPACVTYVEQMRITVEALGRIPPESLSADAERELVEAFRGWAADR